MKSFHSLLAVALLFTPVAAIAQNTSANPPGGAVENPSATPQSSQSGTHPDGMGSTGWTGPHRGQTEKSKGEDGEDRAQAANQPLTATGEDLKGPPTQFAPSKTPE